ncbi:AraC family transcriptional regulator [Spirosoma rigui]|uniref:AraC family transcriptional regulator n=1 Tax=Spirosoma rigui TaxID=564064 RepID=UPI0009AFE046|nr:AraC family transcriptional regulator [Spirosoma rigui]
MTATQHTLSIGAANLVLFAARQCGVDTDLLAQSVGINADRLLDPDGRISVRQMQELWYGVVEATGDPDISLRIGEMINPVAVGVLAYVMMHSPTLGGAFARLCQYQDIVCNAIRTTGRRDGDTFVLSLAITSPDIIVPAYAVNSELSIYLSAIRAMTGQPLSAREIRFAYPRPAVTREHERVFAPARVVFDASETAMVLDATLLDIPVLNASQSLFALFERHADDLLKQLQAPTLTSRVRTEIVALMKGEEPTLATVADRLAMGIRTLQLHLKEEGTTYQLLLDDIRKDLALKHLRDQHLSTTDIAYLLGFAEPSVFFRSFKKWTGQTPGAYRTAEFSPSL